MHTQEYSIAETATETKRQMLLDTWRFAITGRNGADPTEVVIDELSAYFKLSSEEARKRCRGWEQDSLVEWKAKDRSTIDGLVDFYNTQTSWIYDTMWYHAEQCSEAQLPESVDIAEGFHERIPNWGPGKHLDYGAGPGTSSLFFHELSWDVSLADVSSTFLDFARWRLARHGVPATFYDLTTDTLPESAFDLITAIDVMVHVPNIDETFQRINSALKPGGFLVFNIDNRPRTALTEWHLFSEQYPILRRVRRAGFRRHPKIKYFHVYEKVERSPASSRLVNFVDGLRYNIILTSGRKVLGTVKRALRRG